MAKEKSTKDTAKQAKEKTAKTAKKTAAATKTDSKASVVAGRTARSAAKPSATPVEEPVATSAPAPTAATASGPVVNPASATDNDEQANPVDLVEQMTTVSTIGETSMEFQQQEPESSPVEDAGRRRARPKVQYSDAELEEFRVIIEKTRQEAVEEFQILRQNLEDITNSELADENASYSMHMAEQGTEAQEKEKIYAQVQRLNDYIKKLDEALQRIKEKTYGICRVCGILIAKERLIAVPITTLSASYKIQKKCPEDGIDRIVAPRS